MFLDEELSQVGDGERRRTDDHQNLESHQKHEIAAQWALFLGVFCLLLAFVFLMSDDVVQSPDDLLGPLAQVVEMAFRRELRTFFFLSRTFA